MRYLLLFIITANLQAQGLLVKDLKVRREYVSKDDSLELTPAHKILSAPLYEAPKASEKEDSSEYITWSAGAAMKPAKKTKNYKEKITVDMDLIQVSERENDKESDLVDHLVFQTKEKMKSLDMEEQLKIVRAEFRMENTIMEGDADRMKKFKNMQTELSEEDDLNIIEIDSF
jgi:hypothetical protein